MKFESINTDLLASLHAGLFEVPMWQGFLEALRKRTKADHCAMYFRRGDAPSTDATSVFTGSPRSVAIRNLYAETFYRLDPVPYDRLHIGQVYALSEFMLPGNRDHEQYRREYMIPSGMNHKRIMRVTGGSDYNAWLTIWSRNTNFQTASDSLLASLSPHISIALRTFELIERSTIRTQIADEAVRRLNFGWLTLDAKGHIVDIDREGERLLEGVTGQTPALASHLKLADAAAQRKLVETLAEFTNNQSAKPRATRLQDDSGLDMLLLPMRERTLSGAQTAVLIAYLHGESGSSAQRVEQLMNLFRLTRSEARLALGLSRGRSIAEAAAELSLTIETARNYSKRIYNKTGARGQPDLVRIVLASVVALV